MSNEPTHLPWRLQDSVTNPQARLTNFNTKRGKYCCNCENIIGVALAPPGPPDVVIDVPREHTSNATKRGKYCCNCENIIGVALAPPGPRRRDRCPQRTHE
ncbi:hypothetical protein J6590_044130 [Homalodisca vitripennis]|nr:hypothetical protein J6590_044130 [Homalodisca vitripennis]